MKQDVGITIHDPGRMSGGLACGPGCIGLQDGPEDSRASGRAAVKDFNHHPANAFSICHFISNDRSV